MRFDQGRMLLRAALLCCGMTLLLACSSNTNSDTASDLQILVQPAPGGINGETLGVQLTDSSGAPITDATVTVEGNMNHAGMAPVMTDAVTDEADGTADGFYQVPFQFTMLGDWIISVTVARADGSTVTRDINATVGEAEVTTDSPAGSMGEGSDQMAMGTDTEMTDSAGQLMIDQVFARPAPVAGGNGAVYLRLQNGTDQDDQVTGLTTDVAEAAEFHETINDNNVMRMEPRPEGFAIPAGGELLLEPGGKHIMLVNLHEPLADGDLITLTLTFAHAEPMLVEIVVGTEAGPVMDHGSMDHSQHEMGGSD